MDLHQAGTLTNALTLGNRLDVSDFAYDLELHEQIVSELRAGVNALFRQPNARHQRRHASASARERDAVQMALPLFARGPALDLSPFAASRS
jgi:hypothetical protein